MNGALTTRRTKGKRGGLMTQRTNEDYQRAPVPTTLEGLYKDGLIKSGDYNIFDERLNRINIKSTKSAKNRLNTARNMPNQSAQQTLASARSSMNNQSSAQGTINLRVSNAVGGGSLISLNQRQRRLHQVNPAQPFAKSTVQSQASTSIKHLQQFVREQEVIQQKQILPSPPKKKPLSSRLVQNFDIEYHMQAQSNNRQLNQVQSNLKFFRQKSNLKLQQSLSKMQGSNTQGQDIKDKQLEVKLMSGTGYLTNHTGMSAVRGSQDCIKFDRKKLQSARVDGNRPNFATLGMVQGNSSKIMPKVISAKSYLVKQHMIENTEPTARELGKETAMITQRSNALAQMLQENQNNLQQIANMKSASIDEKNIKVFDSLNPTSNQYSQARVRESQRDAGTDKLDPLSPASHTMKQINSQISVTDRHIKKVDTAIGTNTQRVRVLSFGGDHLDPALGSTKRLNGKLSLGGDNQDLDIFNQNNDELPPQKEPEFECNQREDVHDQKGASNDKVVVLVVQKQDTNRELLNIQQTNFQQNPPIKGQEVPSPTEDNAENWKDSDAQYKRHSSNLENGQKATDQENLQDQKRQLIQQSRQIVNYLDLVSKPGVDMLHMGIAKKPRPQTSKVKVDLAKQLYKIPSISKCLEFEILPKNQTLLKNMYSKMVSSGVDNNFIDYPLNMRGSAKKSKTGMNFQSDKKQESRPDLLLIDDNNHSSFTGEQGDQQVDNGSGPLITGGSRSQRAGTMTVRESVAHGKEVSNQMRAKYDRSSINSQSVRKFERQISIDKKASETATITTSGIKKSQVIKEALLKNAFTNNNLVINPTGSFSQIPITNLELDIGFVNPNLQTARLSMQNLRTSQNLRSSGSGFIAVAQDHQYRYMSAKSSDQKKHNKRFIGSVQNHLAYDQQNQFQNLVNRVQSSKQKQDLLSDDVTFQNKANKDLVSDFDDLALSPFEKDDQNNLIKGQRIECENQQHQDRKNWRNQLPAHLKQQLPQTQPNTLKAHQSPNQKGKFPKFKQGGYASMNNERRKPKRMPVKVNLNIDITKNKKITKRQKSDQFIEAPQTAVLNNGASPVKTSDHDNQSLFMLTPQAMMSQQVDQSLAQGANIPQITEQMIQNNVILPHNSRSKSPKKGLQAASSGVASTLIDKADNQRNSFRKIEICNLNNDLIEKNNDMQNTNTLLGTNKNSLYSHPLRKSQRELIARQQDGFQINFEENQQLNVINRTNLPTVQTRGPNTNSSLINLLQTAEENEDENTDGEVRVNSELYRQIPSISKQDENTGLKNTSSVGDLQPRQINRKITNKNLIQSAENGISVATLRIAKNDIADTNYHQEDQNMFAQKLAASSPGHSTSPKNSAGKNSSFAQSKDGFHQVDNCYAEPKLIIEEEDPVRRADKRLSQRDLLNQRAFEASNRLHDAKLNQCQLPNPCKCGSCKVGAQKINKQEFKTSTPTQSQQVKIEQNQPGDNEDKSSTDFKKEAFKLDLHHLSDFKSIEKFELQHDALASDQPISPRHRKKPVLNMKNSERTGVNNSRQNSFKIASNPKSSKLSNSPRVNKRVAIPTGFLKKSRANQISNQSKMEGGDTSRNQDIQQILSTTEEQQTSRIEPLKAMRPNKSPFSEEIKPQHSKKSSLKQSAPGSDRIILQQINDVETLGDKDVLKSFMDHLQRLSAMKKYENMKAIKMTDFDVQLQLPQNLPDSAHASKYNFSPCRKQSSNLTNAYSNAPKNLNLGASIAIMGPQHTKTLTQNLQSSNQKPGSTPQMVNIPLNGMLSQGQKKLQKTRAKSSKQKKKAAKMATIEHELAQDIHTFQLNQDLQQALKTSQTILKLQQESSKRSEHEKLLIQMNQVGQNLNTSLEKHINNTVIITKNQDQQEQMAVQIEHTTLEMLLKTYQNIQLFNQIKQRDNIEVVEGIRNINVVKSGESKSSEDKGQVTLVASSPRDSQPQNQQSCDLSPKMSPRTIGHNMSGEYMESSPGNLSAPMSPIGPSGTNAIQSMLLSTTPRDKNTININDSSVNLKMLQDPTFKVQIINNEKPSIDLVKKNQSSKTVVQNVNNIKFADQSNPQAVYIKRKGEPAISAPSTLHLQQKNKPAKRNEKIFRNKDLKVKQMPILQIISTGDQINMNKDMVSNNIQLLPQMMPQYKYDLSKFQQPNQELKIIKNKQFVTANLAQQKSKEGDNSAGNYTYMQDGDISRNVNTTNNKANLTGQFQLQLLSNQSLENHSLLGMGGPTHGTAQMQISLKGSQNPASSSPKLVEIQENSPSPELVGLEVQDSQSDHRNLVLVNQAQMFLPNEHIMKSEKQEEESFDQKAPDSFDMDEQQASQQTFKMNHEDSSLSPAKETIKFIL